MNEQQQKYEVLVTAPSESGNLPNKSSNTNKTSYWIAYYVFSIILAIFSCYYALIYGNPQLLTRGFDPNHRPCGINDLKDYPLIYFVNPQATSLNASVCVRKCPQVINQPSLKARLDCYPNSRVHSCSLNLHPKDNYILMIYDSFPYMDNVCVPVNSSYFDTVKQELKQMHSYLVDFMNAIPLISAILFVALLEQFSVCFLYNSKYLSLSKFIYLFSGLSCFNIAALFTLGSLFLFILPIAAFQSESKEVLILKESAMEELSGSLEEWWIYLAACFVCLTLFMQRVYFLLLRKHITKTYSVACLLLDFSQQIIDKHENLRFIPFIQGFLIISIQGIFYIILKHLLSIVEISQDPLALPFSHLEYSNKLLEITLFILLLPAFIFTIKIIKQIAFQVHYQAVYGQLNYSTDYQDNQHNSLLALLKVSLSHRIGTIIMNGLIAGFTNWIQYPMNLLEMNWNKNKDNLTVEDFKTKWGYLRSLQQKICERYASSWIKQQNTTNQIKSMLLEYQYSSLISEKSCSLFETDVIASLDLHIDTMKEFNIMFLMLIYSFCHVLFLETALSNTFLTVLCLCLMITEIQPTNRKTICNTILLSFVIISQKYPSQTIKANALQFKKYLSGCMPKNDIKFHSNQNSMTSLPNASFLSLDNIQKYKGQH